MNDQSAPKKDRETEAAAKGRDRSGDKPRAGDQWARVKTLDDDDFEDLVNDLPV
ncbi:hypothetical protein HKCCE2091_04305 [Rhodobacterales bacterium HKCCE2091]|nr:hypothetical protein [Rhodobacterales bacterium HKCCE2091]